MHPQQPSPLVVPSRGLLPIILITVFSTSSIVFIEPAPFDILITLLFVIILCICWPVSVRGLGLAEFSIGIFISANIVSLLFSPQLDMGRATFFFGITIYLAILFQLTATLIGRFGSIALTAIFTGYTASSLLAASIACLAVYDLVPFAETFTKFGGRAKALFKDPNVFAPFLTLAFLYVLSKLEATLTFGQKIGLFILLILLLVANVLSFSRAAMGALALSIGVYLTLRMLQNGLSSASVRRLLLVILFLGSSAFAMWSLLDWGGTKILRGHPNVTWTSRLRLQYYDSDRFYVQKYAIYKAAERPAGYGPGQAELYLPRISHLGTIAIHSTFIRAFFENGWIGLLSIVVFVSCTLYISLRCALLEWPLAPPSAIIFASLCGTIAVSFVIDTLHWRHFWIQAGMAWGVYAFGLRIDFARARAASPGHSAD